MMNPKRIGIETEYTPITSNQSESKEEEEARKLISFIFRFPPFSLSLSLNSFIFSFCAEDHRGQ